MDTREKNIKLSAKALGLIVNKSRARKWSINNHLRYQILYAGNGTILFGEKFDANLDQIEKFLCDYFQEYARNASKMESEAQNMYVEIIRKRLKIRC